MGERVWEPELLRLEGELRLVASPRDAAKPLDHFHRALETARAQGLRGWELRAASSLARRLAADGDAEGARLIVGGVYDRFTEGSDTADLQDAKALLEPQRAARARFSSRLKSRTTGQSSTK